MTTTVMTEDLMTEETPEGLMLTGPDFTAPALLSTPGPWIVRVAEPNYPSVTIRRGGTEIARVRQFGDSGVDGSCVLPYKDNAALIAQSPDLYACLADVLARFEDCLGCYPGSQPGDAAAVQAARECLLRASGGGR